MGFHPYLVIDKCPSAISLRYLSRSEATNTPSPPWQRTVYPTPRQQHHPLCDFVKVALECFCLMVIFLVPSSAVVGISYLATTNLPDSPWFAQIWILNATIIAFYISRAFTKSVLARLRHVHLDGEEGVLVAGRTRIDLSHVCFFHVVEKFAVQKSDTGSVQSVSKRYVMEVVSMYKSIVYMSWPRDTTLLNIVEQLNSLLQSWKLRTQVNTLLPSQVIDQVRGSDGYMKIKRQSHLLRERPQYCSLYIKEKRNSLLFCHRRARLCSWSKALLRLSALGLQIWLICFIVTVHRVKLPLDTEWVKQVIGLTAVWAIPFLFVLALYFRREVWDIRPEGKIRYGIGWACFFMRRSHDVSRASVVTLDIDEARQPGSSTTSGTNKIGGRRFGLSWRDFQGQKLFTIEKLYGGEVAYLADKLRSVCPELCAEEENDV